MYSIFNQKLRADPEQNLFWGGGGGGVRGIFRSVCQLGTKAYFSVILICKFDSPNPLLQIRACRCNSTRFLMHYDDNMSDRHTSTC